MMGLTKHDIGIMLISGYLIGYMLGYHYYF
jgi:hypothetical protein